MKNDWRLTNQLNYLKGKRLIYSNFKQKSPKWDHDHCEFCMKKLDRPEQKAYSTPDYYRWICEECFEDFKEMFEWNVVEDEK